MDSVKAPREVNTLDDLGRPAIIKALGLFSERIITANALTNPMGLCLLALPDELLFYRVVFQLKLCH